MSELMNAAMSRDTAARGLRPTVGLSRMIRRLPVGSPRKVFRLIVWRRAARVIKFSGTAGLVRQALQTIAESKSQILRVELILTTHR
jgi:hypothetical protein